jgi:hypothetical protein
LELLAPFLIEILSSEASYLVGVLILKGEVPADFLLLPLSDGVDLWADLRMLRCGVDPFEPAFLFLAFLVLSGKYYSSSSSFYSLKKYY